MDSPLDSTTVCRYLQQKMEYATACARCIESRSAELRRTGLLGQFTNMHVITRYMKCRVCYRNPFFGKHRRHTIKTNILQCCCVCNRNTALLVCLYNVFPKGELVKFCLRPHFGILLTTEVITSGNRVVVGQTFAEIALYKLQFSSVPCENISPTHKAVMLVKHINKQIVPAK